MITVNLKEFKKQASELVRVVRKTGQEVEIIESGQIVALLIPVEKSDSKAEFAAWTQLDNLDAKIGAQWPKGVSAADAIMEARR